ncbi:hypothetical protein M378DRAFT_16835 [Amanita muscaria Koide BX008]|uniref:Uncharacterized protein n=1 Tax=Amanita muscaria (strain Koide BX008) TaxID=946122 RepID=A0A0C2WKK3_AMAMK|nr:hypothetical protein M378DRAFT_16835 [Amanita muscaria Koide BX008]
MSTLRPQDQVGLEDANFCKGYMRPAKVFVSPPPLPLGNLSNMTWPIKSAYTRLLVPETITSQSGPSHAPLSLHIQIAKSILEGSDEKPPEFKPNPASGPHLRPPEAKPEPAPATEDNEMGEVDEEETTAKKTSTCC